MYRGEKSQKNIAYVGLYIAFFPQLIAGPIVRYKSIADQIDNREESFELFKEGVMRFVQGFVKKMLLANTMAPIADRAFLLVGQDLTVSFAWLGAIAYTLQIYFDFSAYSDMAIGLGKMFGFKFEENFNYPYISVNVTEFWRRWHISLSSWFRDYVYIPLGGNRSRTVLRNYLNLFAVWLLTGIWHGANWTFIVWGMLYFIFVSVEKSTHWGDYTGKYKVIGHFYTMLVVILLWVIFRADGIQQAIQYIGTMFGGYRADFYSNLTWIYIKENSAYLPLAVFLSTDWSRKLMSRIETRVLNGNEKGRRRFEIVELFYEVVLIFLFVVSIIYVINGTYNPFIYFNF